MTSRWLAGVAMIGAAWIAAHALGLLGPFSPMTFVLLSLTTITATIVGVRRYRPALSWPWWSIAGATFLWLVGGAAREALGTVGDLTAQRSLVPDAITLSGYVLFGLGLVGFVRARQRHRDRDVDALLDGAVAALAAFTLAWVFLINPAVFEAGAPLGVRLTLACYPPMSVFLVAVTARLAFCSGRQATTSQRLLLAAMVSMLVGDVVYMFVDARLLDLSRHLLDVPYALAYLLFALNALHPSMRELCEPLPRDEGTPGRGRLTLVAVALGIPALVTSVRGAATPEDRLVLGATVLTLTGAAIWRVTRALGAHARAEARFAYQATHDSLTGLPNRLYLLEHLARHLRELGAGSPRVALLFLDVDRFKLVNDTGGHSLGDDLLVAVARRLRRNVSAGDLVTRIGGDEFVVLLPAVADRAAALAVAERLRASFRTPFSIRGADVYASASIGVSVADGRDSGPVGGLGGGHGGRLSTDIDAEGMIRDADTAMYQAKEAGRDGVAAFDASMRDRASRRLQLEHHLRNALANRELQVLLQPIVRLDRGCVDGFEALLRWRHRTLGEVPPAEFIPIAEDTGLINDIGAWTIDEACRSLRRCRQSLPDAPDLTVAVNVSARQLRDPALLGTVDRALRAPWPAPRRAVPGADRVVADGGPGGGGRDAAGAARARGAAVHRRLRDRLLVALLPQAVPCRQREDRPVLRGRPRGAGWVGEQPRGRHHRPGPRPRHDDGGGGRRDRRAGPASPAAGLRAGAGVPLLPPRPGGGDPGRRAPPGAGAGRRSPRSRPRRARRLLTARRGPAGGDFPR